MSVLNLGDAFETSVVQAAGLDPVDYESGTLSIDFVPTTGNATIRVQRIASVDATQLRALIATAAQPTTT